MRRVESLSHGIKQFALVKLQETLKQLEWPKAFHEVIELEQQVEVALLFVDSADINPSVESTCYSCC